ncbi:MAG: heterodisulfide reductase subunit D [Gammaproteobacteria bacterium]|jgi:heterodisulfide reductase subunit D
MAQAVDNILGALDERVERMLSACTTCGKCVEACPMPATSDIDVSNPKEVIGGVLDLLRTGTGNAAAEKWARICSGSGFCITACDEEVNPRYLLAMARRTLHKRAEAPVRRAAGRKNFKKMSRGVRVLSRLQLPPELIERLSPSSHPRGDTPPELVFYTGCNLIKTPHIGLLCLDVLDRLDVRYEVHGGASSCCGILQMRGGDDENAVRQGARTLESFARTETTEGVAWCPTCQIQFSETMPPSQIPLQTIGAAPQFDMTMFPLYLERRLDDLRPHLTRRVNKRVALHEHPGTAGVTEAVVSLLSAVPGVEVVDLKLPRLGYTLNSLSAVPGAQQKMLATEFAAAEAAGVDTLAGVYHSDHRELAGHHGQWPFEFVNYMEIIGESMGCSREDVFKRLKTMQDVDAILADSADMIRVHDMDLDEVREVVIQDMLNDQTLPIDRREHATWLDAD